MAKLSTNFQSSQLAQVDAVGHALLKPNEMHGRVRFCFFQFATGAGVTDGQNIEMCVLPEGARVIEIFLTFGAMGGTAAVDIGIFGRDGTGFTDKDLSVADDDDFFAAALVISSAGEAVVADTVAQNYAFETLKEVSLVFTAETDNWAGSQNISGHVLYIVD